MMILHESVFIVYRRKVVIFREISVQLCTNKTTALYTILYTYLKLIPLSID